VNRRTFVARTVTAGAAILSSGHDANAQTDDATCETRSPNHQLLRADYWFDVSRHGPDRNVDPPRATAAS